MSAISSEVVTTNVSARTLRFAQAAEIDSLFREAKILGISRKLTQQSAIMQAIRDHPLRNEYDDTLVDIFFFDLERRRGDINKAEAGLTNIKPSEHPLVEFRRLLALSEVANRKAFETPQHDHLTKTRQAGICEGYRSKALNLARSHPDFIDPDLRAYALESQIASLIERGKVDSELREGLRELLEVVKDIPSGPIRTRYTGYTIELLFANFYLKLGDAAKALNHATNATYGASNTSYQMYSSVVALEAISQIQDINKGSTARPFIELINNFFMKEGQNLIDLKQQLISLSKIFPELQVESLS